MEYTPQELALAIRKLIENHPLNWEQGMWYGFTSMSSTVDSIRRDLEEGTCGTTACVAGWAAILVSPDGTKLADYNTCPTSGNLDSIVLPSGAVKHICSVAAKALGLSAEWADWLFDSNRTREEVVNTLTSIENGFDLI